MVTERACAASRWAWLLALSATSLSALLGACGTKNKAAAPQTCDAPAESAKLLRRIAVHPLFGNRLQRDAREYVDYWDLEDDGETLRAKLVHLDGPPLEDTPPWVLRVTRAGWFILPTSDTDTDEPPLALLLDAPSSAETSVSTAHQLVDFLSEIDTSDIAVAADASAPSWLVDLTLGALVSEGTSKTTLLFETKTPIETIMRIPRGFKPDDGMDVIPSLFEDHRAICPQAYAAIQDNDVNGAPTKTLRAMAKAVARCPCETDFALMDGMVFMAQGRLPLASQVVQLTSGEAEAAEAAAEAGSAEAGPAAAGSKTTWLESYAETLAAAKRGPIVTHMPKQQPPPPPSSAGERR